MLELIICCLGVFGGALVQGTTGFGIAFVATPVLMLFLPPTAVPPIMVLLSLVNNTVVLAQARRAISLRIVIPLILAGLVGLPLGAWLLRSADPRAFKLGLGILVVLFALLILAGFRRRVRHERTGLAAVGFLGGVLHTSTSISGPPVILFLANQRVEKDRFRAATIAYFFVMNLASIGVFSAFGMLNRPVLIWAVWLLAPLVLGTLAGVWLALRVNEQLFGRVVLIILILLGLALIATNAQAAPIALHS